MSKIEFRVGPADNTLLARLCGQFDEHLKQIEKRLGVQISNRGELFSIEGDTDASTSAKALIEHLYKMTENETLTSEEVHLSLQESGLEAMQAKAAGAPRNDLVIKTRKSMIQCRGTRQEDYVRSIKERDLTFGIGPAGTGKTFLAVACAVEALESNQVQRLVLVRPAVEAGERLGFLPGDMMQKVDPYLRPIYDALYEFLGIERVSKLVERNIIEIAPLAYMRGRTLNHSCIIMDEAQNTTVEQMKMFLTRIGFGSKAIVTGDISQIDLPKHQLSGLKHVQKVLHGVEGLTESLIQANLQLLLEAPDATDKAHCIDELHLRHCCLVALSMQTALDFTTVSDIELSVQFVDSSTMQSLNQQYRGKNSPTNVLSFESQMPPMISLNKASSGALHALGDLVFCHDVVQREAREQKKTLEHHWIHLIVHGTLHLCGYDHEEPTQADAMEFLEIQILSVLGIPDPYDISN